jgi:alanine dehydrogenase
VVVIGGGVVGWNAAAIALGMQADVVVLDRDVARLEELAERTRGRLRTVFSTRLALEDEVSEADLVIGAVLIPGARAPRLLTRRQLPLLPEHAVLVDVAIDQGGCFETSRSTTHSNPTFTADGILHYCVANMPGAVPVTSTRALTNATLPYVAAIAELGLVGAMERCPELLSGVNVAGSQISHPAVADALGLTWLPADEALRAVTS